MYPFWNKRLYLLVFLLFSFLDQLNLRAEELKTLSLQFVGHLNHEKIQAIHESIENEVPQQIVLRIKSETGEINPVIDIAKELYSLRSRSGTKFIVYIDDEAIGPAAILPFLADELYISPTVAWGAITPSGNDVGMPINILRSRTEGLILPNHPHAAILRLLADAMIDPDFQIIDDKGLRKAQADEKNSALLITRPGLTLVINHNQLKEFGLIEQALPYSDFEKKFTQIQITKTEEKAPNQAEEPSQLKVTSNATLSFEDQLKKFIHIPENQAPQIGHILINDRQNGINQATWIYVNSALDHYKKTKPICIILELNTPGGEVFAAQRISDALKDMDTQYGIPVIAYINNWAISAGAMLAYSCRFIVIAKDASMGAAEPVYIGAGGQPETASEKVNSALRSDFANRAQFFDRNPDMAEAMVDKDVILVLRHGKIMKLDSEDQIHKGGLDPDVIISPKGKLLTLNAQQMMEYGVANYLLQPIKLEPLSDIEEKSGVWLLSQSPLSQIEFFNKIPTAKIESFRMNWQTRFLSFLSSPAISSLLFMGLMVCAYMEISTGGFGIPGAVGLICLFFVILSSYAMEAIHWLEPILFLFGLVLAVLEVFFFPTLGILGVVGVIMMIVGIFGMMLPGISSVKFDGQTLNAAGQYVVMRLTWLSGALLAAFAIIGFLSRYMWPKFGVVQKIVLGDTKLLKETLPVGSIEPPAKGMPAIGSLGKVTSALRPAGKIIIGDQDFDAVSTGNYILEGKQVRVVQIEGPKILVEEIY